MESRVQVVHLGVKNDYSQHLCLHRHKREGRDGDEYQYNGQVHVYLFLLKLTSNFQPIYSSVVFKFSSVRLL